MSGTRVIENIFFALELLLFFEVFLQPYLKMVPVQNRLIPPEIHSIHSVMLVEWVISMYICRRFKMGNCY